MDWKGRSLGWLVSLITIVSSLLFVGSQFGSLQSSVDQVSLGYEQLNKRLEAVETFTHDAAVSASAISTDLSWMKKTMSDLKEQRRELLKTLNKLEGRSKDTPSITIDGTKHYFLKEIN